MLYLILPKASFALGKTFWTSLTNNMGPNGSTKFSRVSRYSWYMVAWLSFLDIVGDTWKCFLSHAFWKYFIRENPWS